MVPWLIDVPAALAAAGGLAAYGAVYPQSQLFGPTVRRTSSPRKFALTFDDGPNPATTPQLLELLDRYTVRATFFVIGRFVRQCPDLVREIAAHGHAIGNHTETHPNLFWLSPSALRDELQRCQDAIVSATGSAPQIMRPPYGFRSPFLQIVMREMDLRDVVMWSLLPGDWRPKPVEWLIGRMAPIASHAQRNFRGGTPAGGGDILCLHDGGHRGLNADRRATLAALEHWLPRWRDVSLEFVTINGVAGTPAH